MISGIKALFPLIDDTGLREDEHCCEWTLAQERKRLHAELDALPKLIGELVEIGTDNRTGIPRVVVLTDEYAIQLVQVNLLYKRVCLVESR